MGEAELLQSAAQIRLVLAQKGRGIHEPALQGSDLSSDHLQDVAHCHPGGDGMGIEQQVGHYARSL